MDMLIFYVCAVAVIVGALGVVLAHNPVHSALFLLLTLVSVAILFLQQDAALVAIIQIVVYASAIVVLFVFVIALLGVDQHESFDEPSMFQRPLAIVLGALLFAGSLTEGGREGWIGLPLGAGCAALAWYASARFFARARARLGSDAGLLSAYGDLIALSIAVVSVVIPPLAFGALAAFVFLLVRGRAAEGRKYEGLRILR